MELLCACAFLCAGVKMCVVGGEDGGDRACARAYVFIYVCDANLGLGSADRLFKVAPRKIRLSPILPAMIYQPAVIVNPCGFRH